MGTILLKNIVSEGIASDILIEGNLIAKIVPSDNQIVVPEGAEVVDCTGKAAFPGNNNSRVALQLFQCCTNVPYYRLATKYQWLY